MGHEKPRALRKKNQQQGNKTEDGTWCFRIKDHLQKVNRQERFSLFFMYLQWPWFIFVKDSLLWGLVFLAENEFVGYLMSSKFFNCNLHFLYELSWATNNISHFSMYHSEGISTNVWPPLLSQSCKLITDSITNQSAKVLGGVWWWYRGEENGGRDDQENLLLVVEANMDILLAEFSLTHKVFCDYPTKTFM